MSRKVRIGIDVGGTFTDAVVIDNETGEVLAKAKTPTTHTAEEGVAKGIIELITQILNEQNICPDDVVFIAHGTTQATNALLEGDVAKVGVIGIGESRMAQSELKIKDIELAPGRYLQVVNHYIELSHFSKETVMQGLEYLKENGAEVIVVSQAYGINDPKNEIQAVKWCQEAGFFATAGHEVSELYGLKVRTATAVINASLIPKMMATADMTEKVVKEIGIKSELMIMRADGGVMSIKEVRKRPILTMLSGLAAGVAGALMYGKVTEGIFFEIGGTSIDISVIKDGKVMIKNARVGGHKTYLKSLDIRTLGIAGGSMIRIKNGDLVDVGPRSAHLGGFEYECFASDAAQATNPSVKLIRPLEGDPDDYAVFEAGGVQYAYTLAGAANILGYIPEKDYAYSCAEMNRLAWETLAAYCQSTVEEVARKVMDIASDKVWATVKPMIEEYELEESFLTLIGGGGSASVLTGYLAERQSVNFKIAENAPYISTIGVAMAMVREQMERSVIHPTNDDIRKLRHDIINKIMESGAKEETIEVTIEVDEQQNKLIATATGANEFKAKDMKKVFLTDEQLHANVAHSVQLEIGEVEAVKKVGRYSAFRGVQTTTKFFGLLKQKKNITAISDNEGVVVLRRIGGTVYWTTKERLEEKLSKIVEELSSYSDAGQTIPAIYVFTPSRMHDYSGLHDYEQLKSLLQLDTEFLKPDDELILVGEKK
ncbi:hydantoinase/oxoprolinase family protein [Listeria costaricensis]|uniref:hydantoinase/oxoprolinase family protein n=1 Tax=Listeria costaricensis TaxID=2026604 RepID=UPI000C073A8A|nr:hydantoinase/oxoprolinase family protein [Listeria costaricensis]